LSIASHPRSSSTRSAVVLPAPELRAEYALALHGLDHPGPG
jgi:hypothetical protein